jgi:hypothetical protein
MYCVCLSTYSATVQIPPVEDIWAAGQKKVWMASFLKSGLLVKIDEECIF